MNTETAIQNAGTLLERWAKETTNPELNRLDVAIRSDDLIDCTRHWFRNRGGTCQPSPGSIWALKPD
jgi:hypothetical protein